MEWTTIATLTARHSLTTAGGYLLSHGLLPDGTTVEGFVGAAMTVLGVAWSVWQKADHAKMVAELQGALNYWRDKKTAPSK